MAPVLFNLYLVIEEWLARVGGVDGIGITVQYKYEQRLFRRYTRKAMISWLTVCLFADDCALLASTRSGAKTAVCAYQQVSKNFGLTVSLPKMKHMVTGRAVEEGDQEPISLEGGNIKAVDEFQYLGSLIAATGKIDSDISRRLAQASKAFGALRKAVFMDKSLCLPIKKRIYNARVLPVLLYGAECWTPLKKYNRKLNSFHHRVILGISNRQQWSEHTTMTEVRGRWGDMETIVDKIRLKRLEWFGHLSRMADNRIPKSVFV